MSGPSKVIVLDPDPRAGRQVQLGFGREGVEAILAEVPEDPTKLELTNRESSLVLVGGSNGAAVEIVRRMRQLLTQNDVDIPIVFAGSGALRSELELAGADEIVMRPAYLRDVVTIGRLLRGVPATQRTHLVGSLVETTGVYTLVRALSALGRSAVLTLVRGLRRGEVRFYKGEVTSAQVGLIHGQAAFHQLLLWTDARFDFHHEDIVRRQQIPLAPDELFADAERFLDGVRTSAGGLSPALVLEQNVLRIHGLGNQVPTEVHGVLRMFDGHRVLADVLEDSPYRVFETLRVAQKAVEAGLLKPIDGQKTKATWRTLLTIEEWLVGSETREAVVARTSQLDSGPIGTSKKKKKRNKKRRNTPPAGTPATKPDIDWGALVPRTVGSEVGPLAGVVPAMASSGEFTVTTRDVKREGLEALMDTDKREKIFPTEVAIEPSVVWNEVAEAEVAAKTPADDEVAAREAADREATVKAEAAAREAAVREAKAKAEAEAQARAAEHEAEMAVKRAAAKAEVERAITARAEAEEQREREQAQSRVREAVDRMRIDRELADLAAKKTQLETERDARKEAARREAEESMAMVKAALERRTREEAEARIRAIAEAEQRAAAARSPVIPGATDDVITEPVPKQELDAATSNASMLVKQLVAEAVAGDVVGDSVRTNVGSALTVTETATATVTVADTVTVVASADTAVLTATPTVTVRETPVASPVVSSGTPVATEDDPSDGVVRGMIATADTARLAARARRPSTSPPENDGPPEKEKTGEIRERPKRTTIEPATSEPSILVTDLAAIHSVIGAALASHSGPVAPTPDASSPARELAVAETRADAIAASEAEEAFFRKADSSHPHMRTSPTESFDDLDEGYEPPKFWDRVFGRQKRPPTNPPFATKPRKK
ncbi:MAG: response regulator receiver protein [Myxococcales bacterium]|nr:response regulator receiver protein [Myxococcales bacterium]